MSWSTKITISFAVFLLFLFKANSQVLKGTPAREGTLKHLVDIKVAVKCVDGKFTHRENIQGAGTVVTYNWVLTAAHVVKDGVEKINEAEMFCSREQIDITAGVKDIRNGAGKQIFSTRRLLEDVISHKIHDVALINISSDPFWPSPTVSMANLLRSGLFWNSNTGVRCVVQGWGNNKIFKDWNGNFRYASDQPHIARQGYLQLLQKRAHAFTYGCKTGTCSQTAPGDSGAPIVCALNKDQDPLVDGYVFAIHSHGKEGMNQKRTDPSRGTDVRVIETWVNDITGEKYGLVYNVLSYVCFLIGC